MPSQTLILIVATAALVVVLILFGLVILLLQRRKAAPEAARICPFCSASVRDSRSSSCPFCLRSFSSAPVEEEKLIRGITADGRPRLIALEGGLRGRDFLVDQEIVIGRGEGSDVPIPHDDLTASRRHARIRHEGAEFVIEDLGSTNGIYVNFNRVSAALLHDRDYLRIGRNLFTFFPGRKVGRDEDMIPLDLPTDLGGYRLTDLVGAGGSMVVYRAVRSSDGAITAVKVPRPRMLANVKFLERAQREVEILTSFSHPNIMKVYDLVQGESFFYIVTEYLEGRLLRKVMQAAGGPLPFSLTADIAAQILEGLDYAHGRGVVHRDIKPENIMICGDGRVKIMDFGIARRQDSYNITRAGTLLGTTFYMSAEQAKGLPADDRSDLYSMGVLLYEMMTGFVPFSGEWTDVISQHIQRQPTSPRELNSALSTNMEALILKALKKNPAERFASAAEMSKALKDCGE
jgi:pSer/pThr/pTyr-binding forkhead associated (FHA) protein